MAGFLTVLGSQQIKNKMRSSNDKSDNQCASEPKMTRSGLRIRSILLKKTTAAQNAVALSARARPCGRYFCNDYIIHTHAVQRPCLFSFKGIKKQFKKIQKLRNYSRIKKVSHRNIFLIKELNKYNNKIIGQSNIMKYFMQKAT